MKIKDKVIIKILTYETGCRINVLDASDGIQDETQVFTDATLAET